MLNIDSLNRARLGTTHLWHNLICSNLTYHIYKYDQLDPIFKLFRVLLKMKKNANKNRNINYFRAPLIDGSCTTRHGTTPTRHNSIARSVYY